jgi:hypothetical protein
MRMRSLQVFTEHLDVTVPAEMSRHPVSIRRRLLRSAEGQRLKLWPRAERRLIPREARGRDGASKVELRLP